MASYTTSNTCSVVKLAIVHMYKQQMNVTVTKACETANNALKNMCIRVTLELDAENTSHFPTLISSLI
jgi:hypothetical protein